jgi:hypothetical protein
MVSALALAVLGCSSPWAVHYERVSGMRQKHVSAEETVYSLTSTPALQHSGIGEQAENKY